MDTGSPATRTVRHPPGGAANGPADVATHWTFLTNHAHVLRALAADADLRIRDVAGLVGITERAALRILADLEHAGYVSRERIGRRTHYRLQLEQPMRHPMERSLPIATLVHALEAGGER